MILGAVHIQRIKSTEPPILGLNPDTDSGAKFTMLGWVLLLERLPLIVLKQKRCSS